MPALIPQPHVVRFLETPSLILHSECYVLSTTITISNHVGEIIDRNVSISASVCLPDGRERLCLRRTAFWTAGIRSLSISIDITHADIEWPARLRVGLSNKDGNLIDDLDGLNDPEENAVISIWSALLTPNGDTFETSGNNERKLIPLSGRTLNITEIVDDDAKHSLRLVYYNSLEGWLNKVQVPEPRANFIPRSTDDLPRIDQDATSQAMPQLGNVQTDQHS